MRTTIALDDEPVEKAQYYTGIMEKSALAREAVTALVQREAALAEMAVAMPAEVMRWVDAHLLAAVRLSPGVRLWTRDRRLGVVGERLRVV